MTAEAKKHLRALVEIEEELGLADADGAWREAKQFLEPSEFGEPLLSGCEHHVNRLCDILNGLGIVDPRLDEATIWITRKKLNGEFRPATFTKEDLVGFKKQLDGHKLRLDTILIHPDDLADILAWQNNQPSAPSTSAPTSMPSTSSRTSRRQRPKRSFASSRTLAVPRSPWRTSPAPSSVYPGGSSRRC